MKIPILIHNFGGVIFCLRREAKKMMRRHPTFHGVRTEYVVLHILVMSEVRLDRDFLLKHVSVTNVGTSRVHVQIRGVSLRKACALVRMILNDEIKALFMH